MPERRKTDRNRTYLGGRIVFNRSACTVDCLIRNLSSGGAKLAFPNTVGIPAAFDLSFRGSGETRRVRIVWARDDAVGVAYERAQPSNVIPFDVSRHSLSDDQRPTQRITPSADRGEPC